jgi:adenosylhomocysteine nucleosidase
MLGAMPYLAFVCAMPMEVVPLVEKLSLTETQIGDVHAYVGRLDGHDVVAIVTGMGTTLAREGLQRLLDAVSVERVLVVGITGALENETPIGTLVWPELVVNGGNASEHRPDPLAVGDRTPRGIMWTTDVLITGADELAALRARGVVSLDMETAALAEVCEERAVPWSVFRVISDRACDGTVDHEVFGLSNQDGTPNVEAITEYLSTHPERVEVLAKMGEDARLASDAAADAAIAAVAHLARRT